MIALSSRGLCARDQAVTSGNFREARHRLGLSVAELATMLGVDPVHVRRMEMQPGKPTHRPVRETTERLVRAYLDGYRPQDWPRAPVAGQSHQEVICA